MNLDVANFKNDLGTFYLRRFTMGTSDSYTYNGRGVVRSRRISIDGYLKRGDSPGSGEGPDQLLSQYLDQIRTGGAGTLTLPHTTLQNIRIESVNYGDGLWIDYMPVTISFIDDFPDRNVYTLEWFGLTIHQPRFSLPVPSARIVDEYTQMPWYDGMINYTLPGVTLARVRTPTPMMDLSLSGFIALDDPENPGVIPTDLIPKLIQRSGLNSVTAMPAGYPIPFTMDKASPQMASRLPLVHIIVTGGNIAWDVENEVIQLQLTMTCQPQQVVVPQ